MKLELLKYVLPFTRYPYEGELVACPVCSCPQASQVASIDRRLKRLPTFACLNCGLLYTNPMPTDDELHEYYQRIYRLDYQGATDTPKKRHLRKRTREAESRLKFLVPLLKPGSRTLDFGCGSGEFLTGLLALGHDAHGFEPGQMYGRYAQSLHDQRVTIQQWQHVNYNSQFDLVSCFHVLEHLKNPVEALKKMVQWTRPGGLVYIEVPDMGTTDRNKGVGAFHFAHLIGFNHHNLLLAGLMAGLQPKVMVTGTGIIFEHRAGSERVRESEETEKGRQLTMSLYGNRRAIYNYFRYQLGKVLGGQRTHAA
ncbi:MAG: class I SAM-dependent methyltransferase [Pirellulaceae bacterium]|nr:class I SAM-dependent methyltransferase [Pirellulaceae bacterium]